MENDTNNPCQEWEAVTPSDTGIECTIKELQYKKNYEKLYDNKSNKVDKMAEFWSQMTKTDAKRKQKIWIVI